MRWLKLHTVIRRNAKVLSLPYGDRWAYVESLVAAKEADPEGEWLNEDEYRVSVSPETFARLPILKSAELIVSDDDGRLRIPQWKKWQYDVEHLSAIDLLARDAGMLKAHRDRDARRKREERAAKRVQKRPGKRPRTEAPNPPVTHKTSVDASVDGHGRERQTVSLRDAATEVASIPTSDASVRMVRCGDCHTPKPSGGLCPRCSPF